MIWLSKKSRWACCPRWPKRADICVNAETLNKWFAALGEIERDYIAAAVPPSFTIPAAAADNPDELDLSTLGNPEVNKIEPMELKG